MRGYTPCAAGARRIGTRTPRAVRCGMRVQVAGGDKVDGTLIRGARAVDVDVEPDLELVVRDQRARAVKRRVVQDHPRAAPASDAARARRYTARRRPSANFRADLRRNRRARGRDIHAPTVIVRLAAAP